MLKEVGASGQISLGKKYAGQLFDIVFYADGRVELVPMKAVPTVQDSSFAQQPDAQSRGVQEEAVAYCVGDGWLTPEWLAARNAAYARTPEEIKAVRSQWEEKNKDAIEAYNRRIEREGSVGWRMYELRKKQAELKAFGAKPA